MTKYTIELDPSQKLPPLAEPASAQPPTHLPQAKHHHTHAAFPVQDVQEDNKLSIYFVGTVRRPHCADQHAGPYAAVSAHLHFVHVLQATTVFESKHFVSVDP